jgi:hypothetical protein
MIQIALTPDELTLVLAALDSHEWGSDSDDEIDAVRALVRRLEAARAGAARQDLTPRILALVARLIEETPPRRPR